MLIKVCGMREPDNIREVAALGIDWMGLIFYPRSPRGIEKGIWEMENENPLISIKKVGVFVDASLEEMMETALLYRLDYLQLHGTETPDTCYALHKRGYSLIKAFSVATPDDLTGTALYEGRVDYFLFDTKCGSYGGSGKQFDWSVLQTYTGETPFLLSGGINPASVAAIESLRHPRFAGIDLNSGFEIEPGLKDVAALKRFIQEIKNN